MSITNRPRSTSLDNCAQNAIVARELSGRFLEMANKPYDPFTGAALYRYNHPAHSNEANSSMIHRSLTSPPMRFLLVLSLLALLLLVGCEQMLPVDPSPPPNIITATPTNTAVSSTTTTTPPPITTTVTSTATTAVTQRDLPAANPTLEPEPDLNDPNLPAWTLLIYMAADNNLAPAAQRDLRALQNVARTSPEVNVLLHVDGLLPDGTAVRTNLADLTLPLTTTHSLNTAVNSGDPAPLADFIAWGQDEYPANHTALILWNHGLGWAGLASDDPSGDLLTLPELAEALDGQTTLDIIGFDACLMNQLDVLTAVAPHANIAVASSELTPGAGWDYERLLANLYENPRQAPADLSRTMVDTFMAYYTQDEPNDFVTLTAVDLRHIPAITRTLNTLSQHLQADLPLNASALADARQGAISDALPTAEDSYLYLTNRTESDDIYTAVDVRDWAAILAARSFDPAVVTTATDLSTAIDEAIIHHGYGRGLAHSNGLALYFPARVREGYRAASQLPNWANLLDAYHAQHESVASDSHSAPTLDLINSFPEAETNVLNPAHLSFQLTGRNINDVHILAGQFTTDGHRYLLEYDTLIPEPTYLPHGRELLTWRDGRHTDFYIWPARATMLSDGTTSDFTIMWPTGQNRILRRLPGTYTTAEGTRFPAHLLFSRANRSLTAVWGVGPNGERFEHTPQPGDLFTPHRFFLDENDQPQAEPGPTTFTVTTAVGQPLLRYEWQPVPDGNYFLGLKASNHAQAASTIFTNLAVTNEASGAADSQQFGYLDPYLGFQFPYPADWYRPVYGDNGLYTTNLDGTAQLQLTLYPDTAATRPSELQADVLARFGAVDLLYEQNTAVGQDPAIPAVMTAYGYRTGSQDRTGLLISFIHDGQGYVLDLDAPATAEAQAISLMDSITRHWQFRPLASQQEQRLFPNHWQRLALDDLSVPQRDDFQVQTAGAWERITANDDPRIFMALQTRPQGDQSLADSLLYWSEVASQGVTGYEPGQLDRFALGNQLWVRQTFRYLDAGTGEEVWGVVMVTQQDGREIVAWAEAPAAVYNEVHGRVFTVMLAEMALIDREGG